MSAAHANGNGLAKYEPPRNAITKREESAGFTESEIDLIKDQIAHGVTDGELKLFLHACKSRQLDPLSKQIYAITREQWNPDTQRREKKMTIMAGIDGLRLNARRGGVEAIDEPEFEYDARLINDRSNPLGIVKATVKVWRKGVDRPTVGVAYWEEYAQTKRDGSLMGQWPKMPRTMIAKCAEAQALRKAAPEELSGLYAPEEMDQAHSEPRDPPEPRREPPKAYQPQPQRAQHIESTVQPEPAAQFLTADEFDGLKEQMETAGTTGTLADLDDLDQKAEGWLSPDQEKEYRGIYKHMKNRIAKRAREAAAPQSATQDAAPESAK